MLGSRIRLLLGAVAVTAALGAGGAAPAQADTTASTQIICIAATPLTPQICTNDTSQTVCALPPEATTENVCVYRNGYDVCFSTGQCITGIGSNITYIRDLALSTVGPWVTFVEAEVAQVQAAVQRLVEYVQQTISQPICVAPLDPTRPICITP